MLSTMISCKTSKTKVEEKQQDIPVAVVKKATIYKTYKDFNQYVPVIMNEARTRIVSYPHPSDVMCEGKLALPTILSDGFLLDNRGIQPNVAFTGYTYEEYATLSEPPTMTELMASIIEKRPLVSLYICGDRSQYNSLDELNQLIENGFEGCEKVDIVSMQVELNMKF